MLEISHVTEMNAFDANSDWEQSPTEIGLLKLPNIKCKEKTKQREHLRTMWQFIKIGVIGTPEE